jgi:hypothetical protein
MLTASSNSDLQTMFSPSISDKKQKTASGKQGQLAATRKWKSKDPKTETLKALMYGVLISLIIVPVNISFAAIIFSDSFYQPHLPGLTKLVLAAGTVHQICFTMRSSLPFAIGQVQDAGLIFLSAMASAIAVQLQGEFPDDEVISTCVCTLALGTSMLGVALVFTVSTSQSRLCFPPFFFSLFAPLPPSLGRAADGPIRAVPPDGPSLRVLRLHRLLLL